MTWQCRMKLNSRDLVWQFVLKLIVGKLGIIDVGALMGLNNLEPLYSLCGPH